MSATKEQVQGWVVCLKEDATYGLRKLDLPGREAYALAELPELTAFPTREEAIQVLQSGLGGAESLFHVQAQ